MSKKDDFFKPLRQTGELIEEAERLAAERDKKFPKEASQTSRMIYVISALYLLLFLVPDSVWLNIGVRLPHEANIPNFVLAAMSFSKFPVSVFIFFAAAPFVFTISLVTFLRMCMTAGHKKVYFLLREKYIEMGRWKYMLIIPIAFMIFLWLAWAHPDSAFDPSRDKLSRPLEYKLGFFCFFGGCIVLVYPYLITCLCLEIRILLHLDNFDEKGDLI